MQPKFSKEQLMRVRDQALMYQCACPAQVSILLAYPIFEQCLADVLLLEGWNMETLEMPELLKKRMVDSV